jgi:hypothetical protein
MAQSRRWRARPSSRIAALALLAAPPVRARRHPSSDHTIPAAGIQFVRLCRLMRVAAAAILPAPARPLSGGAAMRQSYARRLS